MFRKIIAILMMLTLCLFALPAFAEDDATVTAVGTGTVTLTPDRAVFTAGVTTQDTSVMGAQVANAAAMQSVIDDLKSLGIAAEDIQTSNFSVNPLYDYSATSAAEQQKVIGYTVSNTVTVTVRTLDRLAAFLDSAMAHGANQIYGVNFESSQSAAAYDQALATAAQEALRRATLLAKAIGRDVGDVVSIGEANDVYMPYSGKLMAYDAAAGTPIEAGTLTVTANVRAEVTLK